MGENPPTERRGLDPSALAAIRAEYQEIRDRNGGDAIHNPDALAALWLVEKLLPADGSGEGQEARA